MEPGTAKSCDERYREGKWDYLHSIPQRPRYGVVAGYIPAEATVLDIGCGNTILAKAANYKWYVGIDISPKIIADCIGEQLDLARFICGHGHTFNPGGTHDIIVFNQSLHYFEEPMKVVHRLEKHLEPCGCFIVAMELCQNANELWSGLKERYFALAGVTIKDYWSPKTWTVKCLTLLEKHRDKDYFPFDGLSHEEADLQCSSSK